jgi:hypothetical protein
MHSDAVHVRRLNYRGFLKAAQPCRGFAARRIFADDFEEALL